jgi:hypothetical protein
VNFQELNCARTVPQSEISVAQELARINANRAEIVPRPWAYFSRSRSAGCNS